MPPNQNPTVYGGSINDVVPVLSLCKKCNHFEKIEEEQAGFGGYISYNTIYWCYKNPIHEYSGNQYQQPERTCVGTHSIRDHPGLNPVPDYCPYKLEHILEADRASQSGSV